MNKIAALGLTALFCAVSMIGCKDATVAQFDALGSRHKITMYNGGKVVGTWEATGNVNNEDQTDGWYFKDSQTGKLVELTGSIVIEQE